MRNLRLTHRLAAFAVCASLFAGVACADQPDDNTLLEGARLCTRYLPRHERQYGIPMHLLAAIATTESGRYHRALGLNLPWPWTINVEGKGYFFATKDEAVDAVKKLQARGFQSIDVGCMQVNLYHHPYAFASLDQAFDPAYNVAYAAQFLRQNFQDEGSWRKATADYHSHTFSYGEPYARLVFDAWSRIVNKVADARAGRLVANAPSRRPARYASFTLPNKSARHPHLHEISVASDTSQERGVIVVRPHKTAKTGIEIASASSSENDDFVTQRQPRASLPSDVPADTPAVAHKVATAAEEERNAPQVVKLKPARGQFEPGAHIVRVGSNAPDTVASSKNMFVFDN